MEGREEGKKEWKEERNEPEERDLTISLIGGRWEGSTLVVMWNISIKLSNWELEGEVEGEGSDK